MTSTTLPPPDSPAASALPILGATKQKLTGVVALLLAGTDGRPVAVVADDGRADATAAISASSLQLGQRLADLLGTSRLEELTVRSADGYVLVYAVGARWVLTVLTVASANVARINLECRDVCRDLAVAVS